MSDTTPKTRKKRDQGANLTNVSVKKLIEYVGEGGVVPVSTKWLRKAVTDDAMKKLDAENQEVIEEQEEQEAEVKSETANAEVAAGVVAIDFNKV